MPQALSTPAAPAANSHAVVTFETAARLCPNEAVAAKIAHAFSTDAPVDYDAIRRATRDGLMSGAEVLAHHLTGPSAMVLEQHMQQAVAGFVRSAHDAGGSYASNVAGLNASRAEGENAMAYHARHAAEAGLHAYALLAAAHGAVDAYAHVCGRDWKPYEDSAGSGQGIGRRAPTLQASAFARD